MRVWRCACVRAGVRCITGCCATQGERQSAFVEYIKKEWVKKLPLWVKGSLKDIDHSDAYTNAAIEAYHRVLKDLHLKGRKRLEGRRMDWLIEMLLNHVITHYWCVHNTFAHGCVVCAARACSRRTAGAVQCARPHVVPAPRPRCAALRCAPAPPRPRWARPPRPLHLCLRCARVAPALRPAALRPLPPRYTMPAALRPTALRLAALRPAELRLPYNPSRRICARAAPPLRLAALSPACAPLRRAPLSCSPLYCALLRCALLRCAPPRCALLRCVCTATRHAASAPARRRRCAPPRCARCALLRPAAPLCDRRTVCVQARAPPVILALRPHRYKQLRDQKGRKARKEQRQAAAAERAARVASEHGHTDTPPPAESGDADSAGAEGSAAQQPTQDGAGSSQQQARHQVDPKRVVRAVEEVWSELCVLMQRSEELAKAAGDPDTHRVWGVVLKGLRSVREHAASAVVQLETDEPDAAPAPFLTAPGAMAGQSLKRLAPGCSPSKAGHRAVSRVRAAEAKEAQQRAKTAADTQQAPQ